MAPQSTTAKCLRIAFLHPDLGLGGAERLVVDAAVELVNHGHKVDMYTAYYNPQRCFEETRTGGFPVHVAGNWFPRTIGGRLMALCAYIRCILVAFYIAWRCWTGKVPGGYAVIISDQVSAVVPVLRLLLPRTTAQLFYCHFPDMLLTQRRSLLKRLYRAPLDYVEERSTGAAHLVLVNSNFTRGVFGQAFSRLAARGLQPEVLYPCVAIPPAAHLAEAEAAWRRELAGVAVAVGVPAEAAGGAGNAASSAGSGDRSDLASFLAGGPVLLSINRFERKKGLGLAVDALALLRKQDPGSSARLVLAGGYDVRVAENVEHLEELRRAVDQAGLGGHVAFLPSFTDRQRSLLLAACRAVVYTPQHEHFGIVPLEAMAAGRPVIACNNGGPTESVPHGRAGLLCEPTPAAFAAAMRQLLQESQASEMGRAARQHVEGGFSREAFGKQLDAYVQGLVGGKQGAGRGRGRA